MLYILDVTKIGFREAMDLLGISAVDLARELSIPAQSVRQARLDPGKSGYRPPPDGWEAVVARLARERLPEIRELAELDREGGDDA